MQGNRSLARIFLIIAGALAGLVLPHAYWYLIVARPFFSSWLVWDSALGIGLVILIVGVAPLFLSCLALLRMKMLLVPSLVLALCCAVIMKLGGARANNQTMTFEKSN